MKTLHLKHFKLLVTCNVICCSVLLYCNYIPPSITVIFVYRFSRKDDA